MFIDHILRAVFNVRRVFVNGSLRRRHDCAVCIMRIVTSAASGGDGENSVVSVTVRAVCRVRQMFAMLHAVDHRAGAEEEQRLEEGVRHQVEHRRPYAPPRARHHIAKLAMVE